LLASSKEGFMNVLVGYKKGHRGTVSDACGA